MKVDDAEKDKRVRVLEKANHEILAKCPVFLSGDEQWPIPDYGWIEPVTEACLAMEDLNQKHARYGLKAVLAQAKEKFGALRFYYDVTEFQPSKLKSALARVVGKAASLLGPLGVPLHYLAVDLAFPDQSEKREAARKALEKEASRIVAEAERKCAERCQWCGKFGSEDEPLVWTRGWIGCLCRDCADSSGFVYFDEASGLSWKSGKPLEDKSRKLEI